jgi:indole-3-glycerol phosphate synthase
VQAFFSGPQWVPPSGTLGELTRAAFERAEAAARRSGELRNQARDQRPATPFAGALRADVVRVIAEVKRASPSKGAINPDLDAAQQAACYVAGGAAAISVLTEPSRFGGSLDDLALVTARVDVPVIRKDFLVAPVQLWEARAAGASAALVIVRALDPDGLSRLVDAAHETGLSLLFEVRDVHELERAVQAGAEVIGVNNRNLETLVIDPHTATQVIPGIPPGIIAVAESGIRSVDDMLPAARAGADAILVGSAVSAASDPTAAVRALSGVPRRAR